MVMKIPNLIAMETGSRSIKGIPAAKIASSREIVNTNLIGSPLRCGFKPRLYQGGKIGIYD